MSIGGGIALYFIIWWLTLFVVLPFGIRSQMEAGAIAVGTEPGAPAVPGLLRKAIWTTLLASVVFAVIYVLVGYGLLD